MFCSLWVLGILWEWELSFYVRIILRIFHGGSRVPSPINHLPQNASMSCSTGLTAVSVLAATVDTLHSVTSMADLPVFFWTAFYMFFNINLGSYI